VGIYPLLLILLTYLFITLYDRNFRPLRVICKPFRVILKVIGKNWEIRTSVIDSFATFITLSNVKVLSVAYDLLTPVFVYQLNATGTTGEYVRVAKLYYDPTLSYFGHKHLPYAIIGIIAFSLFVLLPTMLLIVYPFKWFQKLLNLFPGSWHILHTFMDSFQGCYKDGMEPGTRDCRWFASMFFILRTGAMIAGGLHENAMFFPLSCMLATIGAMLLMSIQPFKSNVDHLTYTTTMFLLLLGLWCGSLTYINLVTTKTQEAPSHSLWFTAALGTLPLLYISVLILHWVYSHKKFGLQVLGIILAVKGGYSRLD
jgi:hypothetical protein